jgi:RecA-family ATPase
VTKIISWDEVEESDIKEPDFWLNPYVVREGITFIWGKWGVGKSPLTWHMAKAIGTGEGFFGLPTKKGKVLYIDVDSPETVAVDRLKKITKGVSGLDVHFVLDKPYTFPGQDPAQDDLFKKLNDDYTPDVVFFNTLRKMHDLDDKESKSPKMVYSYYQHLFPSSALVFVHHAKKESLDPKARVVTSESFSGSQAWINDAQSALRLEKRVSRAKKMNLRLHHVKSQFTEQLLPLPLYLDEQDGSSMSCYLYEDLKRAHELMLDGKQKGAIYSTLTQERGLSAERARHAVQMVETGRFPESRGFLSRLGGYHEEEE